MMGRPKTSMVLNFIFQAGLRSWRTTDVDRRAPSTLTTQYESVVPTVPAFSHVEHGRPRHCLIVKARSAILMRGRPLEASHTGTSSLRSGWRSRWRSTDCRTWRPASLTPSLMRPLAACARPLSMACAFARLRVGHFPKRDRATPLGKETREREIAPHPARCSARRDAPLPWRFLRAASGRPRAAGRPGAGRCRIAAPPARQWHEAGLGTLLPILYSSVCCLLLRLVCSSCQR